MVTELQLVSPQELRVWVWCVRVIRRWVVPGEQPTGTVFAGEHSPRIQRLVKFTLWLNTRVFLTNTWYVRFRGNISCFLYPNYNGVHWDMKKILHLTLNFQSNNIQNQIDINYNKRSLRQCFEAQTTTHDLKTIITQI